MKPFKQILSEASQQRAQRIGTSLENLEKRMVAKGEESGMVGFDEDDPFDMVNLETELSDQGDPDALKRSSLAQAHIDAESKDYLRRQFIAVRLKDKSPELYHQYRREVRPIVMGNIERKINSISDNIRSLRNMRAPEQLIRQEHERLEKVHNSMEDQMHDHIGRLHRERMESEMRPE